MQLGGRGTNFFFAVERMGEVKDDIFICLFIFIYISPPVKALLGQEEMCPLVRLQRLARARQMAGPRLISSPSPRSKMAKKRKEKKRKLAQNSLSGSPNSSTQIGRESRSSVLLRGSFTKAKVRNSIQPQAGQKKNNSAVGRFQGQATTIGAPQMIWNLKPIGEKWRKKMAVLFSSS